MTARLTIIVSHLVLRSRAEFRPTAQRVTGVAVSRASGADRGAVARECYLRVGARWQWVDRRHWTAGEWRDWLDDTAAEVWVARTNGGIVGFYLLRPVARDVELTYFGLVPDWIGRGVGGWLLGCGVERAWAMGAQRIRLETCTLDGPGALPNYLARGFVVVREEERVKELVDESG